MIFRSFKPFLVDIFEICIYIHHHFQKSPLSKFKNLKNRNSNKCIIYGKNGWSLLMVNHSVFR